MKLVYLGLIATLIVSCGKGVGLPFEEIMAFEPKTWGNLTIIDEKTLRYSDVERENVVRDCEFTYEVVQGNSSRGQVMLKLDEYSDTFVCAPIAGTVPFFASKYPTLGIKKLVIGEFHFTKKL